MLPVFESAAAECATLHAAYADLLVSKQHVRGFRCESAYLSEKP